MTTLKGLPKKLEDKLTQFLQPIDTTVDIEIQALCGKSTSDKPKQIAYDLLIASIFNEAKSVFIISNFKKLIKKEYNQISDMTISRALTELKKRGVIVEIINSKHGRSKVYCVNPFVYRQVHGRGANKRFIESFDEALMEAEDFTKDEALDLYNEVFDFFQQIPNNIGDSSSFQPQESKATSKQKPQEESKPSSRGSRKSKPEPVLSEEEQQIAEAQKAKAEKSVISKLEDLSLNFADKLSELDTNYKGPMTIKQAFESNYMNVVNLLLKKLG